MELLIVVTIVGILVTVGTVQYLEAKRRAKENFCAQRLAQLATWERMYFRDFGEYASYEDLRIEGYIDWDYVKEDDDLLHYNHPVYIQEYKLDFNIETETGGFEITAEPVVNERQLYYARWTPMGGIPELRSMKVNRDGVVMWLDTGRPVF
jgi:type II secretory pathway pseudopilin PulG